MAVPIEYARWKGYPAGANPKHHEGHRKYKSVANENPRHLQLPRRYPHHFCFNLCNNPNLKLKRPSWVFVIQERTSQRKFEKQYQRNGSGVNKWKTDSSTCRGAFWWHFRARHLDEFVSKAICQGATAAFQQDVNHRENGVQICLKAWVHDFASIQRARGGRNFLRYQLSKRYRAFV